MRSVVSPSLAKATERFVRAARWCAVALPLAACVPADEAIGTGSVQFTFTASERTQEGVMDTETDRWSIHFDRIVLGFKTMTIGQIGVADVCSYRGRGAATDVVFDPRAGVVQTFNGIQPVQCPDVGIIFGAPSDTTTLGNGVRSQDLVELASGLPAHAIVEATVTEEPRLSNRPDSTRRILLRFDSLRTSSRFGGCRAAARGVQIVEGGRDRASVRFAAENLFRDAISPRARLRVRPFVQADREGDDDGVVTMAELDALPLAQIFDSSTYQLPNGTRSGSFGDFIRVLFRFSIMFRTEDGLCVGNEPGAEDEGEAPSP